MPKKYLLSYPTTMMIVLADDENEARHIAAQQTGEGVWFERDWATCERIQGNKSVFATLQLREKPKKGV